MYLDEKEIKIYSPVAFISNYNYSSIPYLTFEIEYRKTKSNGELYKNKTTEKKNFICKYCPFCGRKIDKQSESDINE